MMYNEEIKEGSVLTRILFDTLKTLINNKTLATQR